MKTVAQDQVETKHRLITRSNFDGIVNTALLQKINLIDDILYVHPKDVQEGKVAVTDQDIVSNLPYVENAFMAFDHQLDMPEVMKLNKNHALFTDVSSVSEIIFDYYGGEEVFGKEVSAMVEAANRSKRTDFSKEEVLSPRGWDQLIFLTDPRTGLGHFKSFRISNKALMKKLPQLLLTYDIEALLQTPDVKERVDLCEKYHEDFIAQLKRVTKVKEGIAVIDLRAEEVVYPGNRYMVYALFPEVEVSVHILRGVENKNSVFALGKSIFHKHEALNMRDIASVYHGGGHSDAATCQVAHHESDAVLHDIVSRLQQQMIKSREELCATS